MQGIRSRFLKSAFRSLQNCYSPSLSIVIPDCLVHFNLSLFFSLHRTWPCPQKASNKVFVEVRHGTVTLLQALSCPHSHTLMEQLSSSWTVNLATPLLSPLAAFSSTSHTPLVKLNGFFSFTEGFSLSVSISPVYWAPPGFTFLPVSPNLTVSNFSDTHTAPSASLCLLCLSRAQLQLDIPIPVCSLLGLAEGLPISHLFLVSWQALLSILRWVHRTPSLMFLIFPLFPTLPNGIPRWCSGKEFSCQCRRLKRYGLDPWVGKIL